MEKIINIFGDSITWGAFDEKGGWADRLKNFLMADKQNYFEVYNLGISGDDTEGLLKRFEIENNFRNPDVIIVAIGINDSYRINSRENPRISLEIFSKNLEKILDKTDISKKQLIFVGLTKVDERKMMPTPWESNKYYENKNISVYNEKIKEFCSENDLLFIEMFNLLNDDDLEDGLHPNSIGHEKMFLRVKDFLVENKII